VSTSNTNSLFEAGVNDDLEQGKIFWRSTPTIF